MMQLEDTEDYEAGGSMATPGNPINMPQELATMQQRTAAQPPTSSMMLDLNNNGIPDGAEVTFKKTGEDGTTITAKFKQAMPLMESAMPAFQPGQLPTAPQNMARYGQAGSGIMANDYSLSLGQGPRQRVNQFNQQRQGQTNAFNSGIAEENRRKMEYDLAKTKALGEFGGGLLKLQGAEVDAGAAANDALLKAFTGRYGADRQFEAAREANQSRERIAGNEPIVVPRDGRVIHGGREYTNPSASVTPAGTIMGRSSNGTNIIADGKGGMELDRRPSGDEVRDLNIGGGAAAGAGGPDQVKAKIRAANPGKSDAELATLFQKYGA